MILLFKRKENKIYCTFFFSTTYVLKTKQTVISDIDFTLHYCTNKNFVHQKLRKLYNTL